MISLSVVLLFGLVFGSFGAAMAYRIPRELPLGLLARKRSRCPQCDSQILIRDNIPLVSWFLLKGRARCCKKKISKSYPLIEISMGLFFMLSYWVYTQSVLQPFETWAYWLELAKILYFTFALIVTVAIDIEFRIIPDRFSIGGFVVAFGAALLWASPDWVSSLAGAALGFGLFFMLAWIYERVRKIEGLGFGDVKMMAWLGAWLGFNSVPLIVLGASLSGLLVGIFAMLKSKQGFQTALPFGPFLAIAAYLVWIAQSLGWLRFAF